VEYASLEDLLRRSDFVSLHVRLNADTKGLIDRRELAMMKPSSFLINTSRGHVVDEEALCEALSDGRLAGAALDVFTKEPLPAESPLWEAENILLTPHVAGIPIAEATEAEAKMIIDSIRDQSSR
jgi:phosphoglycerate dehydrogenase-like enzyme